MLDQWAISYQTVLLYFKPQLSSIQAFSGLASSLREKTSSGFLTWLWTLHPCPAGPQSVQDLHCPAGPELTLASHICVQNWKAGEDK